MIYCQVLLIVICIGINGNCVRGLMEDMEDMEEKKIQFLYQSIADTQSTIRAIDVKLGFLFVVIFLPVAAISQIFEVYNIISEICLYNFLSLTVLGFYLLSFYFLYKGLISIKPSSAALRQVGVMTENAFYNGDLFSFGFTDVFCNTEKIPNKNLKTKCSELPSNQEQMIESLMFEVIKLTYIRELKLKRSTWCMSCTFLFIFFGAVIWLVTEFKVGL
jgi:hypothetical protein